MNEIVVPALGMWELAESLPDVIVREDPADESKTADSGRDRAKSASGAACGERHARAIWMICVKFIREEYLDDRQFFEGS